MLLLSNTKSAISMRRFVLAVIGVICMGSAHSSSGQWKYTSGLDYSEGDYEDSVKTRMYYVPVSISYSKYHLIGKITSGWLAIDGPGNVVDGGVIPSGGEARTESGMADTWVSLGYELFFIPVNFGYLDIAGKVKFPTADEDKGLGTGMMDYAVQLDYFYPLQKFTPIITAAYKFKGDPENEVETTGKPKKNPKGQEFPDEIDFNDVLYLSVGLDWRYSNEMSFGASIDFQEASVDGTEDALEVFTYVSYKVTKEWGLMPYFYYGLSKSSPDFGGGLQVSYKSK